MSRRPEKTYYSRWSDPILRRLHPVNFAGTSEEEIPSVPRLSASDTKDPASNCCCACCDSQGSTRKSSRLSNNLNETQRLRESLELALVGTQVEQASADDRLSAMIQHLSTVTDALEALTQHIQSLEVVYFSARRVFDLAQHLVFPLLLPFDGSGSHLSTQIGQVEEQRKNRLKELQKILDVCSTRFDCQLMIEDHQRKKNDLSAATKNFKELLNNSKLNIPQIDGLHKQYETILAEYQQSRHTLDLELPKMVQMRLCVLQQGFHLLNQFYNDFDHVQNVGNLFKLVGDNLLRDSKGTRLKEELQVQEICQKCKVNRVDKK